MKRLVSAAAPLLLCGCLAFATDESASAVFTAAQAEGGRITAINVCGKCHTESLRGRTGGPGEVPTVDSIPDELRKVVNQYNGKVRPLVGAEFLKRWETRTTKELSESVRGTVDSWSPVKDDQTALAITAYILWSNGAKPGSQELTRATSVEIGLVTKQN
jgi:cytochrome c553